MCVCVYVVSCVQSLWPHGLQPARLFCPRDFSQQEYWTGLPFPPAVLAAPVVKNLPAGDARDTGSIPGSGRSPGEGNGNPLQYPSLQKSHGQKSLAGCRPWGHKDWAWLGAHMQVQASTITWEAIRTHHHFTMFLLPKSITWIQSWGNSSWGTFYCRDHESQRNSGIIVLDWKKLETWQ